MHQRIKKQTQKTALHKIKKQKLQQKDHKELITFLEKHDYDKTYKDSKIKMTQTQCNIKKKTATKLKNNLKTKMKTTRIEVLELKSLQTTQNTNKNKPKL